MMPSRCGALENRSFTPDRLCELIVVMMLHWDAQSIPTV